MFRACVLAAVLSGLCSVATGAAVPFWGERVSQPAAVAPEALRPGQWVWSPGQAGQGPLLVLVNLDRQLGYVYRNGVLIGWSTVSSGRKGYETPTGVFHTLQKDRAHRSTIYDGAPMPYMQRLTWGGVALHAGGLPGYPSSHGCVHLPSAFAELLFEASPPGLTVVVARGAAAPYDLAHPMPVSPVDPRSGRVEHEPRLGAAEDYRWAPENAPAGPLSLVLSGADGRIVALRNGVEIGRARLSIAEPGQPLGRHAFVARAETSVAAGSGTAATATPALRWMGVALPGQAGEAGRVLPPSALARVRMPQGFLERLLPALADGTSLFVTDEPALPQTTGPALTVITNQPGDT